ncbi:hypothetical protein Tco_1077985 [Tanacetum coccineum]
MPSIRCVNPSIRAYIRRIRLVGHGISSWIQASYLSVLEQLNTVYSHDVDTLLNFFLDYGIDIHSHMTMDIYSIIDLSLSVMWLLRTNPPTCCIMKSGFLTPGGRGVKEKEGLNAGKTISGVESSCNTLSGTNQDNVATKNLLNAGKTTCGAILNNTN